MDAHAMEHQLQQIMMQRQQFSAQQVEIESALSELDETEKSYKIVGNIMVAKDSNDLKKDLEERKKMVELRMQSLDKQEENIRKKVEEMKEDKK